MRSTGGLLWVDNGDSYGGLTDVTLIHPSPGVLAASGTLKAAGYQASDGSAGINTIITNLISGVATNRLTFKNGLLVGNDPL